MEPTDTLHLKLPSRSLGSLSFCANGSGSGSGIELLERWTKDLSSTDYQRSGEDLVHALDELTRLDCSPSGLYEFVEIVRSPVLVTATNIFQRYLKRHITFDSSQQAWVDLCHRLHSGLATAYKAVVQCCLDNDEHGDALAIALHRAISDSAIMYLFHCLLYRPASEGLWLELHILYQIATQHNHQDFQQGDPFDSKCKSLTAENLYKRVLLLSRSDTNKLLSAEIRQIWQILSLWIVHCKIQPKSGLKTYFSVNINKDEGLQYAAPGPDKTYPGVLGLNVRVLTAHLEKIKKDSKISNILPAELIEHLILSWGPMLKRSNPRKISSNHCETCFGFTGLHYHLSGKRDFDDIIAAHSRSLGASSFSGQSGDIWSQAYDAEIVDEDGPASSLTGEAISFSTESTVSTEEFSGSKRPPTLETEIINSSHTGFCMKISGKPPQQFHAGELMGIRQNSESSWGLYSVRWMGGAAQNEVTFCVNFITEVVEAVAISLIRKIQTESHFQRAFMLPDPEEVSLIVPNFFGEEGVKFDLIHNSVLQKGQLTKCIYSTPTWRQYEFRLIG